MQSPDFEYTIHKLAQKRFPQHISAGYELLRFGRLIGPDSLPTDDPYNFVDTGGWYWEAGASRNKFKSINQVILGNAVNKKLVETVTLRINGSATVGDPSRLENRLGAAIYIADKLDDNTPMLVVDEKGKPLEDGLNREFGL